MKSLSSFLRQLNSDPILMAELDRDREAVLAASDLSSGDREMLRSHDAYRLIQQSYGEQPVPQSGGGGGVSAILRS